MDLKKIFQSKIFRNIFIILILVIVLLLVFQLGVFVGYKKAKFSYLWSENYHRNFAGPKAGFFKNFRNGFFGRDDFINAHGIFGLIIKIDNNVLVIKDKDNVEKIVLVLENTFIKKGRETIKLQDLKVNDSIVVIGAPNLKGQIEAKFIRVFNF